MVYTISNYETHKSKAFLDYPEEEASSFETSVSTYQPT